MNKETKENIENLVASGKQKVILAEELSIQIIPPGIPSSQFFHDSARELVKGVITTFILTSPNWTMEDVIEATRSEEALKFTLLKTEETKHLVESYFISKQAMRGFIMIIRSELADYQRLNSFN
jgi:hypothetical protein